MHKSKGLNVEQEFVYKSSMSDAKLAWTNSTTFFVIRSRRRRNFNVVVIQSLTRNADSDRTVRIFSEMTSRDVN